MPGVTAASEVTSRLCPGRKDSDGFTAVFSWSTEPYSKDSKEQLSHLQFTELQKMGRLDQVQGHFGLSKTQPQPHGGTAKPYLIPVFHGSFPHCRNVLDYCVVK